MLFMIIHYLFCSSCLFHASLWPLFSHYVNVIPASFMCLHVQTSVSEGFPLRNISLGFPQECCILLFDLSILVFFVSALSLLCCVCLGGDWRPSVFPVGYYAVLQGVWLMGTT